MGFDPLTAVFEYSADWHLVSSAKTEGTKESVETPDPTRLASLSAVCVSAATPVCPLVLHARVVGIHICERGVVEAVVCSYL